MNKYISEFIVFFEAPFWVGVYQREFNSTYEVCKITFGAEPKDYEVYEFIIKNYNYLEFYRSDGLGTTKQKYINPKRLQRIIKRQLLDTGMGTKSQQALKLQHDEKKLNKKIYSRQQKEYEKALRFEFKQQKRKEKHKGH